MKHKRIYLAFLLILGLLMFSGCATDNGTLDPNPGNNITNNGTVTPNNGTQGADGLDGTGNGGTNNTNDGILNQNKDNNTNDLNQ